MLAPHGGFTCGFLATVDPPRGRPRLAAWEHSPYLRHYRELKRTQYDSPSAIRERQLVKLRELTSHAFNTCEYYRALFDAIGLKPRDIRNFDDFCAVPLLTKQTIRERGQDLLSSDYRGAQLHQ